MKLNDHITINFPETDAEDYDNPFLLQIGTKSEDQEPLQIEMNCDDFPKVSFQTTEMQCEIDGIWLKFYDKETIWITSFGNSTESLINIIKILSKSINLDYLLSALETCHNVEESSFEMTHNDKNDVLFEHFRKMFKRWLSSVGAQADPKSFVQPLSDYLTALSSVVLEEFGIKIFSPKN